MVTRFEFIEFATSPADAPAIQALLRSIGFAKAGRHVSRPVTLWRPGRMNERVNTDQDCFD
ncbi:hypothetical protein [Paracoccus sp. R86501]|uniref:hypothetical protein n=1 Tax=Paracoccus sp. R86501 TaxID=3101711 RepID=UPI00366F5A81